MRRNLPAALVALVLVMALASGSALAIGADPAVVGREHAAAFDHAVALDCHGRVGDRGPAVACAWRAEHELEIAAWQLWKLQVRPEIRARVLVAELGPDQSGYTDAEVNTPALYLYGLLGVDEDGDVVARSRPELVRLGDQRPLAMPLACQLRHTTAARSDQAASDPANIPPAASIACRWAAPDGADVDGYVVQRSVDGAEREVVAEVGADATVFVDHDVALGHRYTYVVGALDARGHVVARTRVVTVGVPTRPAVRLPDRPGQTGGDDEAPRPDRVSDQRTDEHTDEHTDQRLDDWPDDRASTPSGGPGDDVRDAHRATDLSSTSIDARVHLEGSIGSDSALGVDGALSVGLRPADR